MSVRKGAFRQHLSPGGCQVCSDLWQTDARRRPLGSHHRGLDLLPHGPPAARCPLPAGPRDRPSTRRISAAESIALCWRFCCDFLASGSAAQETVPGAAAESVKPDFLLLLLLF